VLQAEQQSAQAAFDSCGGLAVAERPHRLAFVESLGSCHGRIASGGKAHVIDFPIKLGSIFRRNDESGLSRVDRISLPKLGNVRARQRAYGGARRYYPKKSLSTAQAVGRIGRQRQGFSYFGGTSLSMAPQLAVEIPSSTVSPGDQEGRGIDESATSSQLRKNGPLQ